jgi:hypothetical protein
VTQSQAQARQPGGAAIKTYLSQRARRQAGENSAKSQLERAGTATPQALQSARLRPDSAVPGQNPFHSNASTRTRNQESLKFRRIYPNR